MQILSILDDKIKYMKKLRELANFNKIILLLGLLVIFFYQIKGGYNYFNFSPEGQLIVLRVQDFITLVLSIIVEAFPFVILGVSISTLIGINFFGWLKKTTYNNKKLLLPLYLLYFYSSKVDSKFKKNRIYSHVKVSLLGVFLPVCECGNVPVARRLLMGGFTVSQSITFLLAAPILNPVTFLTTLEAFNYDKSIVIIRLLSGFLIANFIGIILSFKKPQNEFLNLDFYQEICEINEHGHSKNTLKEALNIFNREFIEMFKVLIIGAALAAASQTFIPRDIIITIGQNPVLSILAMILLAFVISICSNVDAFFALSYVNSFTIGSVLGFLIFGPMIDIKLLTMLRTTYKAKLLAIVTLFVFLFSFLIALLVNFIK